MFWDIKSHLLEFWFFFSNFINCRLYINILSAIFLFFFFNFKIGFVTNEFVFVDGSEI